MKKPHIRHRTARMASMYRAGMSLGAIGDSYGVTRERVRQLIRKAGVKRNEGGVAVRWGAYVENARERERNHLAARALRMWERYEITMEQFEQLRRAYGPITKRPSPIYCFRMQRRNAHIRKIPWRISFRDWWAIWERSGKYDQRGRAKGQYCMARWGDTGPYSPENVYICLATENIKDGFISRPWSVRFPNGKAGGGKGGMGSKKRALEEKCKRGHLWSTNVMKNGKNWTCRECRKISKHRSA